MNLSGGDLYQRVDIELSNVPLPSALILPQEGTMSGRAIAVIQPPTCIEVFDGCCPVTRLQFIAKASLILGIMTMCSALIPLGFSITASVTCNPLDADAADACAAKSNKDLDWAIGVLLVGMLIGMGGLTFDLIKNCAEDRNRYPRLNPQLEQV